VMPATMDDLMSCAVVGSSALVGRSVLYMECPRDVG
jgi:hypothetical protein